MVKVSEKVFDNRVTFPSLIILKVTFSVATITFVVTITDYNSIIFYNIYT